jgi:hypothetical protein
MVARYQNTNDQEKKTNTDNWLPKDEKREICRCKEASKMSPGQLLKLMMDDLAFWRKGKKG